MAQTASQYNSDVVIHSEDSKKETRWQIIEALGNRKTTTSLSLDTFRNFRRKIKFDEVTV